MEPQGRRRTSPFRVTKRSTKLRRLSKTTRSRVHVQMVGVNAETKKVSAPSRRRRMSLDIPFYRTFPVTALIRHCISEFGYNAQHEAPSPCRLLRHRHLWPGSLSNPISQGTAVFPDSQRINPQSGSWSTSRTKDCDEESHQSQLGIST